VTTDAEPAPAEPRQPFGLAAPFGRLLVAWLALLMVLALPFPFILPTRGPEFFFLTHQDLPVLPLCLALTVALAFVPAFRAPALAASLGGRPGAWAIGLAGLCGLIGALAAPLVFGGYTLSLDEFMADFDAQIFAHGRLMAPIDAQWRALAPALQPMFLLPVPDGDFWASAYLPVNAAMRALGELAHAKWLVNPLLSAFSVAATYGVGRRLWPDRPGLALAAAALLASSPQLIVMSMSAYAMPGHLAFNLAWLWLFLRGGKLGHAGAIGVGFLATGLHQLLFHPLFVAPFILQLLLERRWRLAGLYIGAYALIGGFWLEWWSIELRWLGETPQDAGALGGAWFVERAMDVLGAQRLTNVYAMAQSLVRFVTWQNPVAVPLALLGSVAALREKGAMRSLALGVCLTLFVMLVIMPTQVHGWGYRYAHGLLGSVCLMAAFSWARLTDALPAPRRAAAASAFAVACAVSLAVLTPLRAWQAWSYVRPYAEASAMIQASRAQVVLVDHEGKGGFDPNTLVRNDPFLRRWPKVMAFYDLTEPQLRQLCATRSVAIFDSGNAAAVGIDTVPVIVEPQVRQLRAVLAQLNCGRRMG